MQKQMDRIGCDYQHSLFSKIQSFLIAGALLSLTPISNSWGMDSVDSMGTLKPFFTRYFSLPKVQLSVHAVDFKGGNWDRRDLNVRFERLSNIYAKCNIDLRVQLHELESPEANGVVDLPIKQNLVKILNERPVVFFVESLGESVAQGYGPIFKTNPDYAPLIHSMWVARKDAELEKQGLYLPGASTEAHELGHLIIDQNHRMEKEKNLMADDPNYLDGTITLEQCDLARSNIPLIGK